MAEHQLVILGMGGQAIDVVIGGIAACGDHEGIGEENADGLERIGVQLGNADLQVRSSEQR